MGMTSRKWSGVRTIQAAGQGGRGCAGVTLEDRSKFPRKCPEVLVAWDLKWPEDVFLAVVSLTGFCKHIRVHTCIIGNFGVWLMSSQRDHDFLSPPRRCWPPSISLSPLMSGCKGPWVEKHICYRYTERRGKKDERQTTLYTLASYELNPKSGNSKYILFKNFHSAKCVFSYYGKLNCQILNLFSTPLKIINREELPINQAHCATGYNPVHICPINASGFSKPEVNCLCSMWEGNIHT